MSKKNQRHRNKEQADHAGEGGRGCIGEGMTGASRGRGKPRNRNRGLGVMDNAGGGEGESNKAGQL